MKKILFTLAVSALTFQSCKKDTVQQYKTNASKIDVVKSELSQAKEFRQIDPTALHPQLNWYFILRSDGSADILPGMDTMEKGTYRINDKILTIRTNRQATFEFEVLSETDVKLKGVEAVVLRWKKPN